MLRLALLGRLGAEGYIKDLRKLTGLVENDLLLDDDESMEANRLREDAAEKAQAVVASLAADSGLRKALLQVGLPSTQWVKQSHAHSPFYCYIVPYVFQTRSPLAHCCCVCAGFELVPSVCDVADLRALAG